MKTFVMILVTFCFIVGMNEPALSVDWVAQVSGGKDYQEFMTLTVVTYEIDPDEPIDVVEMELVWWDGEPYFFADFEPDLQAIHWKVLASPSQLVSPSVLFNGDDINFFGVNWLDTDFLYVGPWR